MQQTVAIKMARHDRPCTELLRVGRLHCPILAVLFDMGKPIDRLLGTMVFIGTATVFWKILVNLMFATIGPRIGVGLLSNRWAN